MRKCLNLALGLVFVLSQTSCNRSTLSNQTVPKDKVLRISLSNEVRSLDPRLGIDDCSVIILDMLFEGLMAIDLKGELVHGIANSYEISSDQTTYTFRLRDAAWSNGDPVTAFDFAYAWKKIVGSNAKGSAVHNFYPIKNVQAILRGEKKIEEVGICALDDKTLIVELEHPTPYFLEILATSSFFPINQTVDEKDPHWACKVKKEFVCNGPFMLEDHKHSNEIVVVKSPSYWDAEHVKLPGIKIAIIRDELTQLSLFEKNDLHWVGKPLSKLPLDAVPSLKRKGLFNTVPSVGLYWYFVNTEVFPFTNKKMRQAFSYALNRDEITKHILQEGEKAAYGVLPPSLGVSDKPYFAENNLALARELFAEALVELGLTKEQLPPITLSYNTAEHLRRIAQAVQEQWHKAFGISVQLQQEEWKVHYQKLVQGDYQIGGMGWLSWIKDPKYIMQTFRYKADGINMSRWEHTEYQKMLQDTEQELDSKTRTQLFHQAQALLMEEMPVIPIYFGTLSYIKKPFLKDVYVSELNQILFKWAYLDDSTDTL